MANEANSRFDSTLRMIMGWMFSIALVGLILVLGMYFSNFNTGVSDDQSQWGQFGDFVGGTLNPLFAFLSLLALLTTIHVQSRELAHSTVALNEQSKHLELQAFENTFFSMLRICKDSLRTIEMEDIPGNFSGYRALRKLMTSLQDVYKMQQMLNGRKSEDKRLPENKLIAEAYSRFIITNEKSVGHYIRMIEQLFIFIDSNAPREREMQYWEIVRAQFTQEELILIFYHGLVNRESFYPLKKLKLKGIFQFLDQARLLNTELHKGLTD